MKNDELQQLLVTGKASALDGIKLFDWRLERSDAGVAVAYQLASDAASQSKLQSRLASFKPELLILSSPPSFKIESNYLVVKDGEWANFLNIVCNKFYPLPKKLKLLGVTGTNGKTTTADLVLQLGEQGGLEGFSIGTLGVRQKGKTLEEFGLTTPGQIQLREILHRFGKNADFAVMEVSSHALDQKRVAGLELVAAAWTNLTQDHLDYHGTMESYFAAKLRLKDYLLASGALYIPEEQLALADQLKNISVVKKATTLSVQQKSVLPIFFRTKFNEENLACALAMVKALGVEPTIEGLAKLNPPPGRFYIQEWQGRTAVVDFAHTPDALENILKALKETFSKRKIIVLFGCGGDRDRTKRPLMGKIAAQYADEVIVSSDNPRTEDPEQIIQDIVQGVGAHPSVTTITDRPTAVRETLSKLQQGDVLLLAGKGHEDYIIKGTVKVPYSDIAELDGYISSLKG